MADFLTGRHFRDTPEEYVRQNVEKAVVRQYGYPPSDCTPEFRVKVGSSTKRVDIAVFVDGADHTQENITLIVECKKPGTKRADKKDGIDQLKSYMAACANANLGMWTNGDDRVCFAQRTNSSGTHTFEEVIDVPAFGQTEEHAQRPRKTDLRPATADNLLFAFRRCHNYIAGTEGKQKPEAFWELLKVIFSKIEDERSSSLEFYVTPAELAGGSVSAAPAKARLQKLFDEKVVSKYTQIFPASDRTIELRPNVAAYVVAQLQTYSLLGSPVDVKGVAYEEIVGSNLRGDRGEFFTPRNACRAAVDMLAPTPDEMILDPACGTGGFLITAMNRALDQIELTERSNWADPSIGTREQQQELYRQRGDYLRNSVVGMDLNPGLVRAAKMNMVMNNDGAGGLFQANSLDNPRSWAKEARETVELGLFDVVVTNPPFGANIVVDDPNVLSQYELARVWDEDQDGKWAQRVDAMGRHALQKSQPPEILFIERCVQLLKPGTGRMAIVLPNGILNNHGLGYVRTWLLQNVQLLAVVDMARELFQPKNDTQTSLVLARRLSPDEAAHAREGVLNYPVFMAVAERIGQDKRGNTLWKRTPTGEDVLAKRAETVREVMADGSERTIIVESTERVVDDELGLVAEAYSDWTRRNQQ